MSDMGSAKQVKNELAAAYANEPWYAGVGTSREDGVGFVVRIAVRPGVARPAGVPPKEVRGVRIDVVDAKDDR
jgi:hypothetical protein